MDLTHRFSVPASVEETWAAFNDIESVAGCFPGATVTSVEGDEFKGSCKVRLGPISLVYTGSGKFVERNEEARRFVVEAKGKDKRGNGTAGATVTALMTPGPSETTEVEVVTDLSITGKPAQFGRGVIQDVSEKLLQQFTDCLESKVGPPPEEAGAAEAADAAQAGDAAETAAAARAAGAGEAGVTAGGAAPSRAAAAAATQETPTRDDALDLGATVVPVLIRSYGKQVAAVLAVLFVLWRLLRRRS